MLKLQKDMEQKNVKPSANENVCISNEAEPEKQNQNDINNHSGFKGSTACVSESDDFLGDKILQQ